MKILRNIIIMLVFTTAIFSCQKEIIKPVNQPNTEKATTVMGYDDNGNPIYREVTDPDEDEDFEGVNQN